MVNQFIRLDLINNENPVLINIKNIIYVKPHIIMKNNRPITDKDHTRLTYQEGNDQVVFIINSPVEVFLEKLAKVSDIVW